VFGAWTAAWPSIRTDLNLDYVQIGLLLSLPQVVANLIEPVFGILGDTWNRRALIRAGSVAFVAGLLFIAAADRFWILLVTLMILSPGSGAFVGLSQATLMDLAPQRHEQNMARWALAGSLGMLVGPLALGAAIATGFGWRATFLAFAVFSAAIAATVWTARIAQHREEPAARLGPALVQGVRAALRSLRRKEVVRWLTLLQASDLMLDVFFGFLALYFVDVVGMSGGEAGFAILIWTGVGLLGDMLLIPLIERVDGMRYLRASAVAVLITLPAFLLAGAGIPKLLLVGMLGLLNSGWYSILQARLYSAMPGQSATVLTLMNLFGLAGGLVPLLLGIVADRFGLTAAMWLLLAAPVALLAGLPRRRC
jgi:FSR family fosmidomycin resistance protein-like MFS transporter